MVDLALRHLSGRGVRKDAIQALALLREAVALGSATAKLELGRCYLRGVGMVPDPVTGFTHVRHAAEAGQRAAQAELSELFRLGVGCKEDPVEAFRWAKIGAEADEPTSLCTLAVLHFAGTGGASKDPEIVQKLARRSITYHHGGGYEIIGATYFFGIGVPTNRSLARPWLETALKMGRGSREVHALLGEIHYLENRIGESRKHLEIASGLKHPMALGRLADLCERGIGGPKELDRAISLYQEAAHRGNKSATDSLCHARRFWESACVRIRSTRVK